ncbi:MAG: DUF2225 domain-containing protein [Bacillota bacterium]|nr:DUF2225 domain-containing protein [Bacillota bacterium]
MTQLDPFYDKNFECLVCKKAFRSKKIRTRFIKVTAFETDFAPVYQSNEMNPTLYHIQVCPHCGFTFTEDTFKYFPPGTIESIQEKVSKRWVPRNFSERRTINQALQTYKLAIYCGILKKEKHITLAGMYLRVAWLYRTLQNLDQEQRFMKLALKEYQESYLNDDFRGTQVSEVKLLYLIGELSRRTFQIEQAVKHLSMVIERQRQSVEPKIIEMARDRWQEIREEKALSS